MTYDILGKCDKTVASQGHSHSPSPACHRRQNKRMAKTQPEEVKDTSDGSTLSFEDAAKLDPIMPPTPVQPIINNRAGKTAAEPPLVPLMNAFEQVRGVGPSVGSRRRHGPAVPRGVRWEHQASVE